MTQRDKNGAFAFVDKLKGKLDVRLARRREKRLLREFMGIRRPALKWTRSKRMNRELLEQKLLQWTLSTDSRSVSSVHDTSLRSHVLSKSPAEPTTSETKQPLDETLHFSFSGGGWLMVYMYGVAKALQEQKLDENAKFIGTSAGCLSIVSLVLNSDFDEICDSVINDYVPAAHASWKGPFNMREYLLDAITRHADVNNIDKLHDKVTVVYTSLSKWASRRVSQFKNPIHLLYTMVASCCATPLVGLPFEHEGEYVIDGGLMDNQPLFEGIPTITVSPNVFSDADIRPSRYVPAWWSMYPPSQRDMMWLYDLGYEDALSWSVRQGFPGSKSIVVPTKAAEYDGEWRTVVGQVIGYRWIESVMLAVMILLDLREEAMTCGLLRIEILLWKLVAVVIEVLDRVTLVWAAFTTSLLVVAVLGRHNTLEFGLVLGVLAGIAFITCKGAYAQMNMSEQWRMAQESIAAMERSCSGNPRKSHQRVLSGPQHEALLKCSYVYRIITSFV